MLIYLDTCCLQRPLDDRSQPRINVEAEAILTVLGLVEKKYLTLVSSEALAFEIGRIPDNDRKTKVDEILNLASRYIMLDDGIERNAAQFIQQGIKPMDALHLASALGYGVDCFCTADDTFLKKAKAHATDKTKIVSPLELIAEVAI